MKNGKWEIKKGDCLLLMKQLKPKSIDMIFADPPYNLSNDGITCKSGKMVSVNKGKWDKSQGIENDIIFHEEWIKACKRVLKDTGTIWISGTQHSIYSCGYILQKEGFSLLNDISWLKPNAPPNLACRYFTHSHETLLWAKKDKKAKHIFNYSEMKNGNFPKDFIKNQGKQMRSVWAIFAPKSEEKKFGKHPTQKPVDLLDRIIRASTNKGDLILDPFSGSGTTGVVAIKNNRQFIGFETNQKFIIVSQKRIVEIEKLNKEDLLDK